MIENLQVFLLWKWRISILESEKYWSIEVKFEFESNFFLFCEIEKKRIKKFYISFINGWKTTGIKIQSKHFVSPYEIKF